jgi:DNA-binding response OmpR family regulator
MNNLEYGLDGSEPVFALATSGFPPPARISEPPKTLLVVDDDPVLRDVETLVLRANGYAVLPAEGAAEALRLAREAAAIHLLITDYSMPQVDGLELTRQFREVHPKTPVLMVSGSRVPVRHKVAHLDRFEIMEKPFEFNELLHKVRALLDAAFPLPIRKPWCCD